LTSKDKSDIPELFREPTPQVAWHKQNDYSKSIKPTDKMPIAEIVKMYESGYVLCDTCGRKLPLSECKYSILDHVLHFINSYVLWGCDKCIDDDRKNGRIIGECGPLDS